MTKKSYKKTIRFDDSLNLAINKISNGYGLNFSSTVKILIYDSLLSGKFSSRFKILDDYDKQLLYKILVLYARSASNINQSAHALNELKSLSWLDFNQSEMLNKLNDVSLNLREVDNDFQKYQQVFDKFSSNFSNSKRKRGNY